MPAPAAKLRYPHGRVLLGRTKLAYVHLRNLLTDAKRDRTARVAGYVAIWLLEEFLVREKKESRLNLPLGPLPQKALLHGHCHQKAFDAMGAVESV